MAYSERRFPNLIPADATLIFELNNYRSREYEPDLCVIRKPPHVCISTHRVPLLAINRASDEHLESTGLYVPNTGFIMSHSNRCKAAADAVADDLRPLIKQPQNYPWFYFEENEGKENRARLEQSWMEVQELARPQKTDEMTDLATESFQFSIQRTIKKVLCRYLHEYTGARVASSSIP